MSDKPVYSILDLYVGNILFPKIDGKVQCKTVKNWEINDRLNVSDLRPITIYFEDGTKMPAYLGSVLRSKKLSKD